MFFRSSLVASILAASAVVATPIASTLTARGVKPQCVVADTEASCQNVVNACLFFIGDGNGAQNQLYHQRACVAAATCYGVGKLVDHVACQVGAAVTNQAQESLDYNIYATIVGQCAWDPKGCPITQQNFIDFYYGTLTQLKSSEYPSSSSVVIGWWKAINAWTATGATIPYTNFNDWLHYSSYPTGVISSSLPPITSTVSASISVPTASTAVSSSVIVPITSTVSASISTLAPAPTTA